MTHVTDRLSDYLDRQLDETERTSVESHLAGCAECRSQLSELKAVSESLQAEPQRDLPQGYFDRLRARQSAGNRSAAPAKKVATALVAALAAFIIMGLTLGMLTKRFMPGLFGQIQGMISGAAGSLGNSQGK
jgi:anti-sigma factor RsiW